MNKREEVLNLLEPNQTQTHIPAGFFIHFDENCHRGQAAVDKHLQYVHYTGMDFVKIQYEFLFPHMPGINKPNDWAQIPLLQKDFFADHLALVKGLLKAAQKEALVISTIYSPFVCSRHVVGRQKALEHIAENPEKVKQGMEIVTESLIYLVRECIKLGIDGFYAQTQGGEAHRFGGTSLFDECIKPYDLALMEEMNHSTKFNILHICDNTGPYEDLTPFLDYPGHVINFSGKVGARQMTMKQVSDLFHRPTMGGMKRDGVIVSGGESEIKQVIRQTLDEAPDKFILGADCTLPKDVSWDNVKTAIAAAHAYKRQQG